MENNNWIKQFVLKHKTARDFYFFVSGKTINRKVLDRKISQKCSDTTWYTQKERLKDVVITLTSFGTRIMDLKYSLFSLVNQTVQPEKIVVWLAFGESIPNFLKLYQTQFGIEVNFCSDIRSYTKLVPALKMYSEKILVTVDDDLYYPKKWLESLWCTHKKEIGCIVASYVHEMCFDENQNPLSYKKWKMIVKKHEPSAKLFFCGVGGVLYPPHSLPQETCNENLFKTLAPYADDMWFNIMSLLAGNKIAVSKRPLYKFRHIDVEKDYGLNDRPALLKINVFGDKNQEQLDNLLQYYELSGNRLYNRIMQIERGEV